MDQTAASTGERLVLGAGALLVLDLLFLPWYHAQTLIAGVSVYAVDRTALEPPFGLLAVLAWLATIALLAQILIPRLGHRSLPRLSWSWSRIALVEGLAILGLLVIKFLVTGYLAFGAWVGILLAGAVAYGTWVDATRR